MGRRVPRIRRPNLRDEGHSPDTFPGRPSDQRSTNEGPGCGNGMGIPRPSACTGHRAQDAHAPVFICQSLGRRRRERRGVGRDAEVSSRNSPKANIRDPGTESDRAEFAALGPGSRAAPAAGMTDWPPEKSPSAASPERRTLERFSHRGDAARKLLPASSFGDRPSPACRDKGTKP